MMGQQCCSTKKMCAGIIMVVFGVLFFLGTLNVWPEFTLGKYWPLVVIVVGLHKLACVKCNKDCCEDGGKCCDAPKK